MTIRITVTAADRRTVLKVDGRLRHEDLEELELALRTVEGATALDLSELQSADPDGVVLLRQLVSLGVEVRAASPYIELLLQIK